MKRLTIKYDKVLHYDDGRESNYTTGSYVDCLDKLGQLEDLEEKLGCDLITFLKELNYVVYNSSQTMGCTTKRDPIPADYGYVEDFLKRLKEALCE